MKRVSCMYLTPRKLSQRRCKVNCLLSSAGPRSGGRRSIRRLCYGTKWPSDPTPAPPRGGGPDEPDPAVSRPSSFVFDPSPFASDIVHRLLPERTKPRWMRGNRHGKTPPTRDGACLNRSTRGPFAYPECGGSAGPESCVVCLGILKALEKLQKNGRSHSGIARFFVICSFSLAFDACRSECKACR